MSQIIEIFSYLGEYKKRIWQVFLLTLINVCGSVSTTYIMSVIIDLGIKNGDSGYVLKMGALIVLLTVITCVAGALNKKNVVTISSGLGHNLRMALMDKLSLFTSKEIDDLSKASVISRMTEDVINIQSLVISILGTMLSAPITILVIFAVAFQINRTLSLVFLASVPLLAIMVFFIVKAALPHFSENAKNRDSLTRDVFEDLVNIRLVKGFTRENYISERFSRDADTAKKSGMTAEQITNFNYPFQNLVVNLCVILLLWFGGQKIINGSVQIGELFSLISYTNQILVQIVLMATFMMPVVNALVSCRRVLEMLHMPLAVEDTHTEAASRVKDGSLIFEHVSFDFQPDTPDEQMLLRDIDLQIRDKELVGIVGATGSGKSIFVKLIPRLYELSKGKIVFGGEDILSMSLTELRKEVAFSLQDGMLFSGSIRDNLLFGDPGAAEEDMVRACREAAIYDDLVQKHDEGFDYILEEGGKNLSGGQRQRLCLAVALMKKSRLLIMDDCTSALDKTTERTVIDHIVHDYADRTRILISGKISSIRLCDRILVFHDGKIAGSGTHEELIKNNELYRDICISQCVEQ